FPSLRWDFANLFKPENSPEAVDGEGVKNLVAAAPQDLNRFVFVSSCGVLRQDQFPYNILNAFGVLDAKLTGEKAVQRGLGGPPAEPKAQVASSDASAQSAVQRLHQEAIATSGLPYTIIRPARLIDGPYTSYDLNTLLRAKTNGEKAVIIESGDRLNGETSRIDVANACVEVLFYESTINRDFSIVNSGNRITNTDWSRLFSTLS
ncbi:MAG: NAD(P)H-binding protein, partial [Cyanobacteria bacterium P01_A01_bin.83]